jgi:hypothetical protein
MPIYRTIQCTIGSGTRRSAQPGADLNEQSEIPEEMDKHTSRSREHADQSVQSIAPENWERSACFDVNVVHFSYFLNLAKSDHNTVNPCSFFLSLS